jgi:predicted TPR repeat methyltransferase
MADQSKRLSSVQNALDLDGDAAAIKAYYATWADSYDDDLDGYYTAPRMMTGLLCECLDENEANFPSERSAIEIMDTGCGTGLVGEMLDRSGFRKIDGTDISQEMVDKARELDVYRSLHGNVDVNEAPKAAWVDAYDAVTSCGVFTLGHVPPKALHQLVKMTRPGGLVIASTRTTYYDETDYQAVSDRLVASGQARLVKTLENAPYTQDEDAHYWAYQVAA